MPRNNRNDPAKLRSMLDGPGILEAWSRVNMQLETEHKPVYDYPTNIPVADLKDADFRIVGWEPLSRQDIARLSKQVDSYNRLLNKLLPELKSMDVQDSRYDPREATSNTSRATRLYRLLQSSEQGRSLLQALQGQTANTTPPDPSLPDPAPRTHRTRVEDLYDREQAPWLN